MKHYCREASRLASDAFERELSLIERVRLRLHLWMCEACRNYTFNLGILERALAGIRRHADERAPCLSGKERQRIERALQEAVSSDPNP